MKTKYNITENENLLPFLDIINPEHGVQIEISQDESVVWVHVDGQTVLRICRIKELHK